MTEKLPEMMENTLEYLMALWRDEVRPEEARARLRPLREQYRPVEMALVWEEESYSRSVHYDLLLRPSDAGTISLSFCPDRAVPWPLRRAHHSRESEILRVNGRLVNVQMVMAYLDFIWNEARLIKRLVDSSLIQEEIERRGIEVSEAGLQQAMDAFRRKHQLYTPAATEDWLRQHGQSQEGLEQLIEAEAAAAILRDQIAEGRLEDYFRAHATDFDTAWVARFKVNDLTQARHIREQIRGGELTYFEAACGAFSAEGPGDGKLFAVVRRRELSGAQEAAIFDTAHDGEVVLVPSGDGYELVRVVQLKRGRLDDATRSAIKELLLEEWLAARRQEATVEWFWGDADRVSNHDPESDHR